MSHVCNFPKPAAKEGGWTCHCGKNFRTRRELQEHRKTCEACRVDGKVTTKKSYIEATCPYCGLHKVFVKESYTKHVKRCKENPNRVPCKGHKIPEEEKKLLSKKLKEHYKNTSIWSTQLEKRKSYAEQYFDDCFPELKQNYHVLRYFLDLANPEKKVYLEIDGEQHYNDEKIIEHDKERTELLKKAGWTLIDRIRWSEFSILSFEEKKKKIAELKEQLY